MRNLKNSNAIAAIAGLAGVAIVSLAAHFTRWPGLPFRGYELGYWQTAMAVVFGALWTLLSMRGGVEKRLVFVLASALGAAWFSYLLAALVSEYLLLGTLERFVNGFKQHPVLGALMTVGLMPFFTGAWVYAIAAVFTAKYVAKRRSRAQ